MAISLMLTVNQESATVRRKNSYRGSLVGLLKEVAVRVVYSDESGMGSTKDEPITVIAALMMNMDEHWPNIEAELARIKSEIPSSLLHEEREIKGGRLYSAERKVQRLRAVGEQPAPDLEKARDILFRILAITANYPTPIFYGAVDRLGYEAEVKNRPRSATAHDVAFDSCLSGVERVAHAGLRRDEQILWIHDRRSEDEEKQTKTGLHWVRFVNQMGWDLNAKQYVGRQSIRRVADAIYFGDSKDSLALQLADVCCSTITLHLLETYYEHVQGFWNSKIVGPFYQMIRSGLMNNTEPEYRPTKAQND
jgi:Protein of unknown function (DUF3800)